MQNYVLHVCVYFHAQGLLVRFRHIFSFKGYFLMEILKMNFKKLQTKKREKTQKVVSGELS